jgi:hypothetical protein
MPKEAMTMTTLKDFLTDAQKKEIGPLPMRHSYARKYLGVARPGKTAKKRAQEAARRLAAQQAQKSA